MRREATARWRHHPLLPEAWRRGAAAAGPLRWIVLTLNQLVVVQPSEDVSQAQEAASTICASEAAAPRTAANAEGNLGWGLLKSGSLVTAGKSPPQSGSAAAAKGEEGGVAASNNKSLFQSRRHTAGGSTSTSPSAAWGSALKSWHSWQEKARGAFALGGGEDGG